MIYEQSTKVTDRMPALVAAAKKARQRAYAPYSKHPVGAALLTSDGIIIAAPNVENAAYPLGSCAETNAIGMMVASGARRIMAVAISGPGKLACTPCGGCRQRLWEFAEPETPVFIYDNEDNLIDHYTLAHLLPSAFSGENTQEITLEKRLEND